MTNYPDYISPKRVPVETPEAIVENGQAPLGNFLTRFKSLQLLECENPVGDCMPECMKKAKLPELEAVELQSDEWTL